MGLLMLAKIAKCRNPGTNSRESSSRLPATSAAWFDDPVTFPPGRARLATKPVPTGSPADANTIGMTDVACFAARTDAVPQVTMTSTFSRTNSAAISARRSLRPSAPSIFDCDCAALDPTKLAQSLHQRGDPLAGGRRCSRTEETNRAVLALLRVRRERPRRQRPRAPD